MNQNIHTWECKSLKGESTFVSLAEMELNIQTGETTQTLSIAEFYDRYNPLGDIRLTDQLQIFEALSQKDFPLLQGKALHCHHFWKAALQIDFPFTTYTYETKVTNPYLWKLDVSSTGFQYKDISGSYGYPNTIYEQALADFWFYGPLYPIPDISLRSNLIHQIKNRLALAGFVFDDSHFTLITYPDFVRFPDWSDGDYIASNFVIMRSYGVEYGRQNFHDGLVFLSFASYEHCLNRMDMAGNILTQDIIDLIKEKL